jgi:hypothetical protein
MVYPAGKEQKLDLKFSAVRNFTPCERFVRQREPMVPGRLGREKQ